MDNRSFIENGAPDAVAPYALALDHFNSRRYVEAYSTLAQALQAEPNNAHLWNLAGSTAKMLGLRQVAQRCWRFAIQLVPDFAEAHYNLGMALQESVNPTGDVAAYRTALLRPAWHPQALNNLGVALIRDQKPHEALSCFDQAIKLAPDYSKSHNNRARALRVLGQMEDAVKSLETAIIGASPRDKVRCYQNLATMKRFSADDPAIVEMEQMIHSVATLGVAYEIALRFALGKAYADAGQPARSFHHLLLANQERRRQLNYDESATLERFGRIQSAFTPDIFRAGKALGSSSEVPIFIVGMPRSGSSLIEQVLASHPQVHGAGEIEDFRTLAEGARLPDGAYLLPDGIARIRPGDAQVLGHRYLKALQARAPQARRVTDKNLANFAHVGLIHLLFPQAKIIHAQRDAIDTCLSCFSHLFEGQHAYSYDLRELGRYWRAYDRLMEHWRHVLPAGVMLDVRYEHLVDDLEGTSRTLIAHCGLDWNEACLRFHATQRAVFTASAHQVRQPIYRTSLRRSDAYGDLLRPLTETLAQRS